MSWPSALDAASDLLIAVNNWSTTIVNAVGPTDTNIIIASSQYIQAQNGVVSLEDEVILYDHVDVGAFTSTLVGCTRGYDGTVGRAHPAGATVELRWIAAHHNRLSAAILALESFIGIQPQNDLNGVSYTDLVSRLNGNLPLVSPQASATSWVIQHNRKRLVAVELWQQVSAGTYQQIDAPITQQVSSTGTSTITVTFGTSSVAGYAILL